MKKTILLSLTFFLILMNIYVVSVQSENLNTYPATKTAIQKYPDYAV